MQRLKIMVPALSFPKQYSVVVSRFRGKRKPLIQQSLTWPGKALNLSPSESLPLSFVGAKKKPRHPPGLLLVKIMGCRRGELNFRFQISGLLSHV